MRRFQTEAYLGFRGRGRGKLRHVRPGKGLPVRRQKLPSLCPKVLSNIRKRCDDGVITKASDVRMHDKSLEIGAIRTILKRYDPRPSGCNRNVRST